MSSWLRHWLFSREPFRYFYRRRLCPPPRCHRRSTAPSCLRSTASRRCRKSPFAPETPFGHRRSTASCHPPGRGNSRSLARRRRKRGSRRWPELRVALHRSQSHHDNSSGNRSSKSGCPFSLPDIQPFLCPRADETKSAFPQPPPDR